MRKVERRGRECSRACISFVDLVDGDPKRRVVLRRASVVEIPAPRSRCNGRKTENC